MRTLHTDRVAILWSANPIETRLLGSPATHAGYLESYRSVVWDVYFPNANLEQFEYPMSGYIYTTTTQKVNHRARILDMQQGFPAEFRDAMPPWRNLSEYTKDLDEYISILIDQIDEMHPPRAISDFIKLNGDAVKAPPQARFTLVRDPLY